MIFGFPKVLQQPTTTKLLLYYYFVTFMLLYTNQIIYGNSITSTDTERLQQLEQTLEKSIKDEIHPKLGRQISNLVDMDKTNHRRETSTRDSSNGTTTRIDDAIPYSSSSSSSSSSSNIKVTQYNTVLVDVIGNGKVGNMANQLQIDGFTTVTIINCYKHMCSMYIPIDQLVDIANLPYIQFISPAQFKANAGSVTTEGDVAMFTDRVRSTYNVDGSGLRICILSDSFDCLGNAQKDINTGDLPPFASDVFTPTVSPNTDDFVPTLNLPPIAIPPIAIPPIAIPPIAIPPIAIPPIRTPPIGFPPIRIPPIGIPPIFRRARRHTQVVPTLPLDIQPTPASILFVDDLTPGECELYNAQDEGRSMMQIIHDIAPGAQLAFRTAYRGQADFAAGINFLAFGELGCDIIVDDVTYVTEPFFQDGIIAQEVDLVASYGVLYFTAIGNAGRNSWETPFGFVNSTKKGPFNRFFHSFGMDNNGIPIVYQGVTIPNIDEDITFIFQWSEPYASATCSCSNNTNGVDLDIGFAVYNASSGVYITIASGDDYNVGYDPIEVVTFNPKSTIGVNTNAAFLNIFMYIQTYDGTSTDFMKVIVLSEFTIINVTFEFNINGGSSTSFGHANSQFGASVGAAKYLQTPAFGVSPPIVEPYSSLGGTPIFFNKTGSRLPTAGSRRLQSGQQRQQPRFAGPDGTSTTNKYKPTRQRISGTSTAAAHVAGHAALLMEATNQIVTNNRMLATNQLKGPNEIFSILARSAAETGVSEYDYSGGFGFVDAVAAFELANVTVPTSPSCGLFHLSIFCLRGCGFFKRILGIGGC